MKKLILYVWNESGEPFGIFNSKAEAKKALAEAADYIKTTINNLKLDLYCYELSLNNIYNP